mgnify:CR=1 FL=1
MSRKNKKEDDFEFKVVSFMLGFSLGLTFIAFPALYSFGSAGFAVTLILSAISGLITKHYFCKDM